MNKNLTAGKIVRYHAGKDTDVDMNGADAVPAIVTQTFGDNQTMANLNVFSPTKGGVSKLSVQHATIAPEGNASWSWPDEDLTSKATTGDDANAEEPAAAEGGN